MKEKKNEIIKVQFIYILDLRCLNYAPINMLLPFILCSIQQNLSFLIKTNSDRNQRKPKSRV